MAKQTVKVPGDVLKALMEEFQLNPRKLEDAIKVNQATLRLVTLNKSKITVPIALKLAKFFGTTADFWIDLQINYELAEAAKNVDLQKDIKGIEKVQKPAPKEKPVRRKTAAPPKAGRKPKAVKEEKAPKTARVSRTAKPRTPKPLAESELSLED